MRTRNVEKLGKNIQVSWFKNKNAYVSDVEAVKVLIENKLRTILGEIWTNVNLGIPYFDKISDKETYDLYIKKEITSIPQVVEIATIDSKVSNYEYHANIKVITNVGEVYVQV